MGLGLRLYYISLCHAVPVITGAQLCPAFMLAPAYGSSPEQAWQYTEASSLDL